MNFSTLRTYLFNITPNYSQSNFYLSVNNGFRLSLLRGGLFMEWQNTKRRCVRVRYSARGRKKISKKNSADWGKGGLKGKRIKSPATARKKSFNAVSLNEFPFFDLLIPFFPTQTVSPQFHVPHIRTNTPKWQLFALIFILIAFSCAENSTRTRRTHNGKKAFWSYRGEKNAGKYTVERQMKNHQQWKIVLINQSVSFPS